MKKIGLIVLAMVLALGALGAAYAYWTQTITVNAAVETGYVQASFTNPVAAATFADTAVTPYGVAWYTTSIGDSSGDTLNVALSNAYPGMEAVIPVTIENTGSIPIGNIAGLATASNLPTGSSATLTGSGLGGELAVGASTNADIMVSVPVGSGPDNASFVQNNSSYSFTMTVTSTQFTPGTQFNVDGTGVTAGKYGP
jgi:hypothetical protein